MTYVSVSRGEDAGRVLGWALALTGVLPGAGAPPRRFAPARRTAARPGDPAGAVDAVTSFTDRGMAGVFWPP